ncbi:MAG: hypothetical protein Q4F97_12630, partial [Bacteroidales bacterium]|nr:hypothetical protein [Bacteroidales bacterium]
MKLKFIIASLCLVFGLSAFAQETTNQKARPRQNKEYPSQEMIKDLNLNKDQIAAIKKLQQERTAQFEKLRKDSKSNESTSREEMRTQMQKSREKYTADMK